MVNMSIRKLPYLGRRSTKTGLRAAITSRHSNGLLLFMADRIIDPYFFKSKAGDCQRCPLPHHVKDHLARWNVCRTTSGTNKKTLFIKQRVKPRRYCENSLVNRCTLQTGELANEIIWYQDSRLFLWGYVYSKCIWISQWQLRSVTHVDREISDEVLGRVMENW